MPTCGELFRPRGYLGTSRLATVRSHLFHRRPNLLAVGAFFRFQFGGGMAKELHPSRQRICSRFSCFSSEPGDVCSWDRQSLASRAFAKAALPRRARSGGGWCAHRAISSKRMHCQRHSEHRACRAVHSWRMYAARRPNFRRRGRAPVVGLVWRQTLQALGSEDRQSRRLTELRGGSVFRVPCLCQGDVTTTCAQQRGSRRDWHGTPHSPQSTPVHA